MEGLLKTSNSFFCLVEIEMTAYPKNEIEIGLAQLLLHGDQDLSNDLN